MGGPEGSPGWVACLGWVARAGRRGGSVGMGRLPGVGRPGGLPAWGPKAGLGPQNVEKPLEGYSFRRRTELCLKERETSGCETLHFGYVFMANSSKPLRHSSMSAANVVIRMTKVNF